MNKFMKEDFLLETKEAEILYDNYAKDMPIIDFHCHLSPKEIAEDKKYKNITEIWLDGDHYKWRAMRANGIEEKYITGDASDYEKFMAWAKTMPYCLGNPLYHWSHLELKRYFGIDELLNESTADDIWNRTKELLEKDDFSARRLLERQKVEVVCTTDDPIDSLNYHRDIREDKDFNIKVLPTLRPDKGIKIENDEFLDWMDKLAKVSDIEIKNYEDFLKALENRVDFFHENGARVSDHGLDTLLYMDASLEEVIEIFNKKLNGEVLTNDDIAKYQGYTIIQLAKMYNERNWVMQLHLGAIRNNNKRMFGKLGPDTGFDSIGDQLIARPLSDLMNRIEDNSGLPKTILYTLNSGYNEIIATMIGNFQDGKTPGKIQFGSGWWFHDQKDGMEKQLTALANFGMLRRFVGMLTDSRSFLSYTRHEYFRRVLCNLVGNWMNNGEVPYDYNLIGSMIEEICYYNSIDYFELD